MRDIKRIDPMLKEFEELWKMYPDLRLGQLISILASKYLGKDTNTFFPEDDLWLVAIRKMKKDN